MGCLHQGEIKCHSLTYMINSALFMPPFLKGGAVLAGEKVEIDNASCIQSLPIILEYSA